MKIGALIPARLSSERLPGKALAQICDRPMIAHLLDRVAACAIAHEIRGATLQRRDVAHVVTGRPLGPGTAGATRCFCRRAKGQREGKSRREDGMTHRLNHGT